MLHLLSTMFAHKMLTYLSRSGRDCSCQNPSACPELKEVKIILFFFSPCNLPITLTKQQHAKQTQVKSHYCLRLFTKDSSRYFKY